MKEALSSTLLWGKIDVLDFWQIRFIDNTDPAGIDHQIAQLGTELASTLVIVISKVCMEIKLFLFEYGVSGIYYCMSLNYEFLFIFRVVVPLRLEMAC